MKNTIKTVVLLMFAGFFTACQESQTTEQVLADEAQRQEIMQTIVNKHDMMMEMMGMMMNGQYSKMMMSGNKEMMGMMMGDQQIMQDMMKETPGMMEGMMQNMMEMCQNDSAQSDYMIEMMYGNHMMMQGMMDKMHQNGMMNEECYQDGMNNMGAGMMSGNGMSGQNGHGQ